MEKRRIYLARGYSSLFALMMAELGYSESAAQRRIAAMRLIRDIPEVKTKIETGEISLSVASQVGSYFRQEAQNRREQNEKPASKEEKLNLLESLQGTSSRECEKKLAELAPELCLPKEKARPITADKTLVQFTANQDLMHKIEKLKTLLSHQNKTGSLEELFAIVSTIALEKLDPEQREARRQDRQSKKTNNETLSPPAPEVNPRSPEARAMGSLALSNDRVSPAISPALSATKSGAATKPNANTATHEPEKSVVRRKDSNSIIFIPILLATKAPIRICN